MLAKYEDKCALKVVAFIDPHVQDLEKKFIAHVIDSAVLMVL